MDNQDQTRTHTQGHESHGVHVCHKCGSPFPNPHPSAKHRRAHKRICGTVEGYKLLVSEGQTHSNASDDEHLSDDGHKAQGPNASDTGNYEKGSGGTGDKSNRSENEVFSDAVADFSDVGQSPRIKEPLGDSLESATDLEIVQRKYPEFPGSSEDNGSNAADVSQLIVKSRDDGQMQNPKILQRERFEDGNMLELQVQMSGSTMDPLSSSIADLRTEELTVAHSDDCFGLSSDSNSSKAEATPDGLLENKIYAGKNVGDCSLTSVAKETNLKGRDEIKSGTEMFENVVSSNNNVGETCEVVSNMAVSEVDVVISDCQVAERAFNVKEKNSAEILSVMPQDDLPLGVNSTISTNTSTNGVRVESALIIKSAASRDVKTLQEREEGNVNMFTLPSSDDRPDVAHPQSEHEDFKDHEGVVSQKSLSLHSSEALKQERDALKESVTEESNFLINQSQLGEKREVLSLGMHVLESSMKKEQVNCELMADEMHAKESIEVSPVKHMVETIEKSDEIGASMNDTKAEMNESHVVHFSEERGSDDVGKNSQQISLPEGSFMAASNESPIGTSLGSATNETTRVISIDNISHHEKKLTEINDVAVDGKCGGANVKNDIEISMKTPQLSNLHSEVKPSTDVHKSDDAVEMGKVEKCDITNASSNFESPVLSEVVMDVSARTPKGIECTKRSPLSDALEDINDDEVKSNGKVNEECYRLVGTSADSRQAQDAELLVKAADDLGGSNSLVSSLNVEPSAQHVAAVEDTQDGEPRWKVSRITALPVQDQSGNNEVKLASSAIYTSVDSGSRCDSLQANWGSVSVLSRQSDAQAVIDAEALPSTDLLASTEAGKSNLEDPKTASERQQCEKPEMFEPPSFMTLVEPGHVIGPKADASGVQKVPNQQHPSSTSSQAGWFPTLTQVTNESQGRKRNEEIMAKVANLSPSKQHKPLKSLLGEAAHSNKPKSPKLEEDSVNQKNGKVTEDNGSGLTTVDSSLGPKSPAAQALKGEDQKQWNSLASYPAEIKREKKKVKSRPYWVQFICCSSVDPQRR